MVKNRVLFCKNSLCGNAWCHLATFYDVILPIDHVSLKLDGVTSFLCVINIRNTCKRLRYSQTFGGISSMQWLKVGRIWRIQLLFFIVSCVSVSCKQINHSRFAFVVWSPLHWPPNSELFLKNSLLEMIYFLLTHYFLFVFNTTTKMSTVAGYHALHAPLLSLIFQV